MVLFDDGLSRFGPLADLRATFEQRLGVLTCIERTMLVLGRVDALYPPSYLSAVVTERLMSSKTLVGRLPPHAQEVLVINGSLDSLDDAATLTLGEAVVTSDNRVAMARFLVKDAERFLEAPGDASRLLRTIVRRNLSQGTTIRAPWDLLGRLEQSIPADIALMNRTGELNDRSTAGVIRFGHHALLMDPTARVLPGAIIDTTEGPVLLAHGAIIRPGAVVSGPVALLENSTIVDRAQIKARTVIGPDCKVGGEVGSSVFYGHSNKAHEGHLGDALVGEWVNFGAGTCSSNLLNTYGEVTSRLDAAGTNEMTGRTFYGGVIGDHAKTAILVALNTGSTIGTGAMIAVARPPTFVDRFAWLTPERSQSYRFNRFETTVRAVMARRDLAPGDAYFARLRALHDAHASRAGIE